MDVVKKWAQEHYPWMVNNNDFIVRAYRKMVLHEAVQEKEIHYPAVRTIDELSDNVAGLIMGAGIESRDPKSFMACKTCGKKECTDTTHAGLIRRLVVTMTFGDDSGMISAAFFVDADKVKELTDAYAIIAIGRKDTSEKYGESFKVNSWFPMTEDDTKAFTDLRDFLIANDSPPHSIPIATYKQWINRYYNTPEYAKIQAMEKYLLTGKDDTFVYVNLP